MAGILPFGAVFIELFFIFSAIWQNQFYYLFGFLFLVFCILVVSCGQIAIVMTYFQLCGEVCFCFKQFSEFFDYFFLKFFFRIIDGGGRVLLYLEDQLYIFYFIVFFIFLQNLK